MALEGWDPQCPAASLPPACGESPGQAASAAACHRPAPTGPSLQSQSLRCHHFGLAYCFGSEGVVFRKPL